jgi:phospholipid/cholesterol/gamma-HCH transport system permease protein
MAGARGAGLPAGEAVAALSASPVFLAAHQAEQGLTLDLLGEWRLLDLPGIDAQLARIDLTGAHSLVIDTGQLQALDLSSAWRLREFLETARKAGVTVSFRGTPPDQLRLIDQTLERLHTASAPPRPPARFSPLRSLGRQTVHFVRDATGLLSFLGETVVTFLRALIRGGKSLRPVSVARHVYDTGITAVPIVALIGFLISVIVAYMSAEELHNYGADVFVVDLVTIGVLRELGVLLTAIIVAGRSGSAFAAEIGAMRLNEEVDALRATGVEPYEVLVVPRVLGLTIALPLLTVIADGVGLLGGALLCHSILQMPFSQYLSRVNESISPTTFWVGLVKAPFFAVAIALSGCRRGMQVSGSSRELGNLTTVAVVESIFMVILADAMFAVLFMEMEV